MWLQSLRLLLGFQFAVIGAAAQSIHELVQFHPGSRVGYGLEYDASRGEVIAFGGLGHSTMWSWDGGRWQRLSTAAAGPMARGDVSTTSDPSTGRVFAYGGSNGTSTSTELWQWNGSTWSLLSTAGPSARGRCALAFDPVAQALYLHGGVSPTNTQLGELWRFQGGAWTQLASGAPRYSHTMVWNPLLAGGAGGLLVFGGDLGFGGGSFTNDTWTWTGTWNRVSTVGPVLPGHSMCYDSGRSRVVLVGAVLGATTCQTWEWTGLAWSQMPSTFVPPARSGARVAFDVGRQRTVLYGGSASTARYDTWEWNGVDWANVTDELGSPAGVVTAHDEARGAQVYLTHEDIGGVPSSETWELVWPVLKRTGVLGPSARLEPMMWYDPIAAKTMIFGGRDAVTLAMLAETWAYDGLLWTQLAPLTQPSARIAAACAYDRSRNRTVLFGGLDSRTILQDTWEWDGVTWTQVFMPLVPSPRFAAALGYDPMSNALVLFGDNTGTSFSNETWSYDGSEWKPLSPAQSPSARSASAMVTDRDRNRLVMFGGAATGPLEIWEWSDRRWSLLGQEALPPQGWSGTYDPARGRAQIVQFDGFRAELAVPFASVGPGSLSAAPSLTCATRPAVGGTLALQTTPALGGPVIAIISLSVPQTPVSITAVVCRLAPFYLRSLDLLVPMSTQSVSMTIPASASLEFLGLAVQAAELQPNCVTLSNALAIRLQPQ